MQGYLEYYTVRGPNKHFDKDTAELKSRILLIASKQIYVRNLLKGIVIRTGTGKHYTAKYCKKHSRKNTTDYKAKDLKTNSRIFPQETVKLVRKACKDYA